MESHEIVLVFGSFDQVHPGHLFFLEEAKKKGNMLYVVLARDETIAHLKEKPPKYPEEERKKHLEITGIPDEVLLGDTGDKYAIIEKVKPTLICLGYDQRHFADDLEGELRKRELAVSIIRLPAYKEHLFKSSKLK